VLRDLFLGFIRIHILYHASHGSVFGLSLIRELRRHGYDVSPGTLYPMLHRLEKAGHLRREDRLVSGKVRKYYTITEEGKAALAEAKARIRELTDEVLEERGPAKGLPEGDE
jgi:DNA-binding PadR family transcriptional regulator